MPVGDPVDLADIIEELDPSQRAAVFHELNVEHASDTLEEIDEEHVEDILSEITPEARQETEKLLAYEPDSAGGVRGLRPLRYEKRIARNRFILLVIILLVILLGVFSIFLHNH